MEAASDFDPILHGRRILVVEDEMLVAMEIESLLETHGCIVIGPAPTVRQACDLLSAGDLDAALLDLNLGGEPATPVARELRARSVPFVVVSGYGGSQRKAPEIADAVQVEKPFDHTTLLRSLAEAMAALPERPEEPTRG